eukprot:scaffold8121_cov258-Pinguiococcus_pyrenoidosus.AAC.4
MPWRCPLSGHRAKQIRRVCARVSSATLPRRDSMICGCAKVLVAGPTGRGKDVGDHIPRPTIS